jgi:hypothetical protein
MRIHVFMRLALLLLVIAAPILVRAQFQPPTDEELKMTADPKAPGASAVYLYYEMTADYPHHNSGFYVRIKVLTEKGKDLATVSIPYVPEIDKVTDIEGRTIHADGTVIPLIAKPDDLMAVKVKGFQMNSIIFTLPGVEVGSILEYRVKFHRDEEYSVWPSWQVQKEYFVHKAHYSFNLGNSVHILYTSHLRSDAKVVKDNKGVFTLDISDVPPEPGDDWMPPLNTLRWRVEFFYTTDSDRELFWGLAAGRWFEGVQNFIKPTGQLKQIVAGIVAPDDSERKKAEKIYAAAMKLENIDFTRQKSRVERKKEKLKDIEKAEDIWKQKSGPGWEIALLYAALARVAGLKAWPMQVVNRNDALFDKSYLDAHQFDDYIVMLELDGKQVYLDPGEKMCPFGSLHWKHTWATGFLLQEKTTVFSTTPGLTYMDSTVKRVANLDIDETGNLKGTVRIVMTGPNSLYWRQQAILNDEDEVKKQFNESMLADLPEGMQADFDHFEALNDNTIALVAFVNVSGNIGAATGKHFFLPGLFFESRAKHPFVAQDKRTIPVDVHFPLLQLDEVTYRLPPGFNVESMPQDANTTWPDHAFFKIRSSANVKDGSVTVLRTLAYNFTLLDPKEYPNLHDFFLKVAAADQQQLLLTRAPVAKGN